jgi:nucleotide-binding universal stress UspA family protein
VVAAVDGSAESGRVTDAAIRLATSLGSPVAVLHVLETDVVDGDAVDLEADAEARQMVADHVARVRAAGLTGDGHVVHAVGDHGADGRWIAEFARAHHARAIVVGSTREPGFSALFHPDVTSEVVRAAASRVLVVPVDTDEPATVAAQPASSTSANER